jgi:LPS-assembly protein
MGSRRSGRRHGRRRRSVRHDRAETQVQAPPFASSYARSERPHAPSRGLIGAALVMSHLGRRAGAIDSRRALAAATTLAGVSAALALILPDRNAYAAMQRAQQPIVVVGKPTSKNAPDTFVADQVQTDTKTNITTWTGNVQVWQGDQAMRADVITYDRNSGVLAARGHVAITEPDGSTTYSDYVELSDGMKDGITTQMYARMQNNAKLAANGSRRTAGQINDMTHAVYTACEICLKHPERAPFWQFQAFDATQDHEHQRLEFSHAWLEFFGYPVFYMPIFSMSDPSVKRQSGFLMPGISPHDRYLGTYLTVPYFWAIDKQSDLTVQGLVSTRTGPQITGQYRNLMNFGSLSVLGAVAYDTHRQGAFTNTFGNSVSAQDDRGLQGYVFAQGMFDINRNWRAGANVNLASSANYMRDYRISGYGSQTLNSNVYLEGFGIGSYARLDSQYYQGLNQGVISDSALPFVLPRFTYAFQGQPDVLGGRFSAQSTDFDLYRPDGVSDQRAQLQMNWNRPFHNKLGQQWLLTLRVDSMVYRANELYKQPLYYGTGHNQTTGQVLPTVALKMNWPFLRTFAHGNGTQILEPIVQAIAAPNTGNSANDYLPNEDSLSYEFTDSTLFSLNRNLGTDRLDGGLRGNVGLHTNWTWRGHVIDMLVGESLQEHIDHNQLPYSGLMHHASDPVGRIRFTPNRFVDLTARGRYDPWHGRVDFGEGLLSAGVPLFHVNAGYIYQPVTPYYYYATNYRVSGPTSIYYTPTNEVTAGFSTHYKEYHVSAYARRSLSRKAFVAVGGDLGYSNDCFGLDILAIKQYTYIGGQQRNTTILFNFTFKTIGTFGING